MKNLVVIPAKNEAESLPSVIGEIRKKFNRADILVVDDGSRDETASVAQKLGVSVLVLPFNLGIAGAREAGFWYAKQYDYDFLIQMDADGQHDPKFIKDLLQPIFKNECDVVIGSRFLSRAYQDQTSRPRYLGISLLSFFLTILTGKKVTDPTSGFSVYNKKAISFLLRNFPNDYSEPEVPLLLSRAGLRFKEIPVKSRPRIGGYSSISYKNAVYYLGKVLVSMFITALRKIDR